MKYRVGAACRANGKAMGTAVNPGDAMKLAVERGTTWLNCCADVDAITNGYASGLEATEAIINSSGQS